MQSPSISVRGLSSTRPASLAPCVGVPGTAVITMPGAPRPLYSVPATVKPRTLQVLIRHARERLAPFGIPDLESWAVEVIQDDDDYQVDFVNNQGARFCVNAIQLTPNKCGVAYDYGISASVD